jgi:hypothetical protein
VRLLPVVLVLVACGNAQNAQSDAPPAKPIDCAWFTADNCWKQAVRSAEACRESSRGTLADESLSCTFPDGGLVTFPGPPPEQENPSFTLTRGGATCVSFEDTFSRATSTETFTVTSATGTVTVEEPPEGMRVTCPDGSVYAIDFTKDRVICDTAGWLPGWAFTNGAYGTDVWFVFLSDVVEPSVFVCR